jgi:Transposase, Mutator family
MLVTAEVALAFLLLVGAGLVLRSFQSLLKEHRGFQTTHRLMFSLSYPDRYGENGRGKQFIDDFLEKLSANPEIVSSGAVSARPVEGPNYGMGIGAASASDSPPWAGWRIITPGYLRTVGLPLLRGRNFDQADKPVWAERGQPPPSHRTVMLSLREHAFCAMMIDGTHFDGQQLITVLGITVHGQKLALGLRQGATENVTVIKQLLDDLRERGVDFEVPRLYVLDGGKALSAAVRRVAGKSGFIQRCQVHKIRNVVEHLTEEHQGHVRQKLLSAYGMREYVDAQRALARLVRELMDLNPSAARSLEEGMEETLTVHRLRVPPQLRTSLASTNAIESAFSIVETVCRNVKRWQGGDQYLRWVASGLLYAESRWNRVHGFRELPIVVKELELAVIKDIPLRHATVA